MTVLVSSLRQQSAHCSAGVQEGSRIRRLARVLYRSCRPASATMMRSSLPGEVMLRKYQTSIGSFTRKSTFFWASVGATVGLANLWQFPYLASIHGGGLFILLYLACLLIVTLPLMVTEAVIGRHARHGIVLAMDGMVKNAGCSPFWRLAGPLSILAAFVVLSFTAVFGGIVLAYIFFGAADRFEGASAASATAVLSELVSDPGHYRQFMAWHVFFVILLVAVSARGVVKGLERSMRMIVPCTLLLMLVLFGLAAMRGSLQSGVDHVLVMRPEQVTAASLKAAFFHAFYTLGLGMGVWAIFGAYSTSHTRLKRSILAVVLMDTLVAIMAGLMMFSVAAAPIGLFTSSLSESYWAHAANLYKSGLYRELNRNFKKTTLRLTWGIPPILILCCLGPLIVGPIFGKEEWSEAGLLLLVMAPMFIGNLVFSPTNHLVVLKRQSLQLFADLIRIILISFAIISSSYMSWNVYFAIMLSSIASLIGHSVLFIIHIYEHKKLIK